MGQMNFLFNIVIPIVHQKMEGFATTEGGEWFVWGLSQWESHCGTTPGAYHNGGVNENFTPAQLST